MAIAALPDITVRALGSGIVLNTPVDLVKELLENAIDAKATLIEILISANTVDKVEVRDNGTGMHPADFDQLGRHGCTSKLRSFDELRELGGTTLGFRGEALASAATLGTLAITTRSTDLPVATLLHFGRNGQGIEKRKQTGAPVGTSVEVTELFANLPVRKKMVVKDCQKTVAKIKELLYSYVLARPEIKLSFKVLKNSKSTWSYSPGSDAGLEEATLQIFGTAARRQLHLRTLSVTQPDSIHSKDATRDVPETINFQALLPKLGADMTTLSKGAYVSVDGRPISAATGTAKKLYQSFKKHLKRSSDGAGTDTCRDPLLILDIHCPPGIYDVNINPAKNDILFANEDILFEAFQNLCDEIYGSLDTADSVVPAKSNNPSNDSGEVATATASEDRLGGYSIVQNPRGTQNKPLSSTNRMLQRDAGQNDVRDQLRDSLLTPDPTPMSSRPGLAGHEISSDEPTNSVGLFGEEATGRLKFVPARDLIGSGGSLRTISGSPLRARDRQGPEAAWADRHEDDHLEAEDSAGDLNPWTIAKMNAPRPRQSRKSALVFEPPRPSSQRSGDAAMGGPDAFSSLLRHGNDSMSELSSVRYDLTNADDGFLCEASGTIANPKPKNHGNGRRGSDRFTRARTRPSAAAGRSSQGRPGFDGLQSPPPSSPVRLNHDSVSWKLRPSADSHKYRQATLSCESGPVSTLSPSTVEESAAFDTSRKGAFQITQESPAWNSSDTSVNHIDNGTQKQQPAGGGKLQRLRSDTLPLERTPRGESTTHLVWNIVLDLSQLALNNAALAAYDQYILKNKSVWGLDTALRETITQLDANNDF